MKSRKMFGAVFAILLAVLFIGGIAQAQQWYPANQATVMWDPVTTIDNGSPVPAGDVIKYHLWAAPASDPAKTNKNDMGTTDQTQMTLTFQAEGRYYAGVQTERWVGGVLESQSAIGWSDDPVIVANQNTFGFKYFLPPGMAHGLRK
jgi:hypothetical protein